MWINKHLKINSFKNRTHPRRIKFYHPWEYSKGWAQWYESHSERREVPGVRVARLGQRAASQGLLGIDAHRLGQLCTDWTVSLITLAWLCVRGQNVVLEDLIHCFTHLSASWESGHHSRMGLISAEWTSLRHMIRWNWQDIVSEYVVYNACCVCIKITFQRASKVLGSCFHLCDSVESLR